jgi:hypothetical protein
MAKIMQEMSTSKHIRDHQKSLMNGSIGLYELSFWFEEELLRKKLQPKKKELYQFQALLDRRDQLKQKLSSKAKISKQKNIPKSKRKYDSSHFSLKKITETNDSMTSQINHLHAVSCEIERVFRMHRHLDSYIIEQETTQVCFKPLSIEFVLIFDPLLGPSCIRSSVSRSCNSISLNVFFY